MNAPEVKTLSSLIKEHVAEAGFDLCGFAPVRSLDEHQSRISDWVIAGMNADMAYLGQNIAKRTDPGILFPGARSVIVTGLNYYARKKQGGNGVPVLSRYAYGANYHYVIKSKLNQVISFIREMHPGASGKAFVDSAPLLEKAWGSEAGLGFPGKHSVLINRDLGSFFFLGIILINIDLEYDQPSREDYCRNCRLCIDSCPTGAINDNRTIDSGKCISFLTLESKTSVPDELVTKLGGRIFGCDRCQEVCPWNKNSKPNRTPEFELPEEVRLMTADNWKSLTRKDYKRLFKNSAIGRRSYCRFMDNIQAATAEGD